MIQNDFVEKQKKVNNELQNQIEDLSKKLQQERGSLAASQEVVNSQLRRQVEDLSEKLQEERDRFDFYAHEMQLKNIKQSIEDSIMVSVILALICLSFSLNLISLGAPPLNVLVGFGMSFGLLVRAGVLLVRAFKLSWGEFKALFARIRNDD